MLGNQIQDLHLHYCEGWIHDPWVHRCLAENLVVVAAAVVVPAAVVVAAVVVPAELAATTG